MGEIGQEVLGVPASPSLCGASPLSPQAVSAKGAIANATVATLKAARDLLSDPARWTREKVARNATGEGCPANSSEAVCWCTQGAVHAQSPIGSTFFEPINRAYDALAQSLRDGGYAYSERPGSLNIVASWNDAPERTHAEVLDLFDRTIARLESEAVNANGSCTTAFRSCVMTAPTSARFTTPRSSPCPTRRS